MSTQQVKDSMFLSAVSFDVRSQSAKIDGFKMVDDIYYLCGLKRRQLPLAINRDWHPIVLDVYKKLVSKIIDFPEYDITYVIPSGIKFYIYELFPIDYWDGYHILYMGDVYHSPQWRDLVFHSLNILKHNSSWEGDIREGVYFQRLPKNNYGFDDSALFLKQDNNGTTFVVSINKLEHLEDYFVKCVTLKKDDDTVGIEYLK